MEKLILYMSPVSAPSRSVIYLAKYIGVDLEYRHINLMRRETLKPDFLKLNPLHTVPTLVDGKSIIYDSHAICAYLVEKYAKNDHLYPKDLTNRALVDAILHFDSCDLFSPMRLMYVAVFYHGSYELSKEIMNSIKQSWETLEHLLEKHEYLCGNEMTIADICCIATISAVVTNVPIDEKMNPKLYAWLNRMRSKSFYDDDGAEGLQKLVMEKLEENRKGKVAK
ncbi:glutathione S-transferase 1-like [Haematobia irritans]|uniref:glutathione S-transferase 1-like n=1 Tax=Haematobia irritans TaxID=7368 RepID=UPI003F50AECC